MKEKSDIILNRLRLISDQVQDSFRKKGMVIPVKNADGTVSVGFYLIRKTKGFYVIEDFAGEVVVDKINLPQSAVILANSLALGRALDREIKNADQNYGFAEFEERLHNSIAEKHIKTNVDKACLMLAKSSVNRSKKEYYRAQIVERFEKLRKIA